jgi:class 3 adenylate cyclase/tetratricopeptide (TPR) repeat protein
MPDSASLSVYVPDLLLERLAEGRPAAQDESSPLLAAAFFADLAGFTAMADRLAEQGSQGPEQLTEVLDHVFGALIDRVLQHGGDVVRFAGDAILVLWRAADAEGLPAAVASAAACALQALATPLEHPYLPGVSLRLRIGINAGPLRMVRVGGLLDRYEFVVTGQALRGMGLAAEHAQPGQALVAAEAWELLQGRVQGRRAGPGLFLLEALRVAPPASGSAVRSRFDGVSELAVRPFIPGAVRHRFDAGMSIFLAELRPLSVIFVNLPVAEGRPPPDRALLQQFVHLGQRELYRYEGAVDKLLMDDKGCTLLASFGLSPLAHEDDAERALRAALGIHAHLRVRGVSHRIGVATGRVYAGAYGHPQRREYSILGDTVNLAARLMQQAHDQVLCDEATRRAAGARVEFEALEPARVKGKRQPVARYRPVRALDSAAHTLPQGVRAGAPELVGRRPEIEALEAALRALIDQGQGGLLVLQGEAGIGKSALVAWLLARASELGVQPRFGSGDAIERSAAYRAWRPIIAALAGFTDAAALDEASAHVLEAVGDHPWAESWAPLLNAVLPLDLPENEVTVAMTGPVRGENTRDLLVHLLRGVTAQEPLLIVLEDAHWMDPASLSLLAAVQRRVGSALLVLATRPIPDDPPPELAAMMAPEAGGRCLELQGLGPAEVHELAARALGVDELPEALHALLLERAEGNPLYTGELVGSLEALGALRRDGRHLRLDGEGLEQLRLPDTVQGAVTSRLDRLDPHQQLTLKVASVVGRSFPYQVTHDVHPVRTERGRVEGHLRISVRQGLLSLEVPDPSSVYRFQHSVTQQVAYDLLAHAQRRQIHSAVARWYEHAPSDDDAGQLARLAYHWQRAGDDAKTLYYCTRAGEHAAARGATKEAIDFLRAAVRLMERSQQRKGRSADWLHRVRTRRRLGEAYASVSESRLALEQLLAALRELGRPFPSSRTGRSARAAVELSRLVFGLVWPSSLRRPLRGERRELVEELARVEARVADELFALTDLLGMALASLGAINHAERMGFYEPAVHAYNAIGYVLGVMGLRGLGERFLSRARTGDALAVCNGHYARGLWLLGDACFDDSEAEIRAGLEHARAVGDPAAIATGISCLGTRFELVGDYAGALRLWRELLHVADRMADERHELWATTSIGGSLCMRGQVQDGLDWMRRREDLLAQEDRMTAVGFHGQRAQVFLRAGELALARESAELTHQYVRETGAHIFTHIKGLTGLCETTLALWELGLARGSVDPALPRSARGACRFFDRYAKRFPVGRPRATRFAGTAAWLAGKPGKARRLWSQAVRRARSLGMDYDEALALIELARFAPVDGPERAEHLTRAAALAEPMGGELRAWVERVRSGLPLWGSEAP